MAGGAGLGPTSEVPDLSDMSREERIEAMVAWFRENFDDPAQETPHDSGEGGYQYIWGGPYDASEEISEAFSSSADEDEILEAVESVQDEDGIYDWAPAGWRIREEYDDEDHESNEPLDARLAALSGELNWLAEQVEQLRGRGLIGHNKPPDQFRIAVSDEELSAIEDSVAEVREELAKANAIETADPSVLERAAERLRALGAKVGAAIWSAGKWTANAAGAAVVGDAVLDPQGFATKVQHITETLTIWAHHLSALF